MAKNEFKWKWWHVLVVIWFFTGLIELNLGVIWQYVGNIQRLLIYNGFLQMVEGGLVVMAKIMTVVK